MLALAQAGPMQVELIQPTSEPNAYRDSVPAGSGACFHHVCTWSHDLDADIDDRTIIVNDFQDFFDRHPAVNHVFFNGGKAYSVYRKHVLPRLDPRHAALPLTRLPSTSPAHAAMSLEQKSKAWQVVRNLGLE